MRSPSSRALWAPLITAMLVACDAPPLAHPEPLRAVAAHTAKADPAPKSDLLPAAEWPTWSRHAPSSWDRDRDGAVTWSEWRRGLSDTGLFARWDRNGDGLVGRVELGHGLFDSFDLDRDGRISPIEYDVSAAQWWGGVGRIGGHVALDRDRDGGVDRAELVAGVGPEGLLALWDADADGTLHEREFSRSLLAAWDRDADGALGPGEGPDAARQPWLAGGQPEP